MTDAEIEQYVELAAGDPDPTMGGAALADLLRWKGLTRVQLERWSGDPRFDRKFLQRIIGPRRLQLELEEGLTPELLERCLASNDDGIIRTVARDLSLERLEELAAESPSSLVRHYADVELRARRPKQKRRRNSPKPPLDI
jgi:hypothetical protein